ncbi:MAG: sensor histidine kinase [Gemmatimonadales bacterium]
MRDQRQWRLQLAGWLGCGLIYYLAIMPLTNLPPGRLLLFKLGWALGGFGSGQALMWLFGARWLAGVPKARLIGVVAVASLVLTGVWYVVLDAVAGLFLPGGAAALYSSASIPFVLLNNFCFLVAFSGGSLAVQSWREVAERERQLAEAAVLAKDAHLETLRYQLNPHFLFNALTTLRALIGENPEIARRVVGELAGFLRATLDPRTGPRRPLSEELAMMDRYLSIERIRFEDRLRASVECDPAVRDLEVPTFILQPLVENAIRHSTPEPDGAVTVRVRAFPAGHGAVLEVENPGRLGVPSAAGSGGRIGLRNVAARLAAAGNGPDAFALEEHDGWVTARITFDPEHGTDGHSRADR